MTKHKPNCVIEAKDDGISSCDCGATARAAEKAEIEAALKLMRELARDPAKKAEMEAAWGVACDGLEAHYKALRPKPKVFEVHHMNEVARFRFACAFAAGRPLAECAALAVERITR